MGKRILTITIGIVGIVVLVIVGWYIMFMNFGIGPKFPFLKTQEMEMDSLEHMTVADNSLMSEAETEEEAQEIAEQYGIELISFENGLALYHTEEDPFEVIARGQENGYPQLSMNFIRTGYDTNEMQ